MSRLPALIVAPAGARVVALVGAQAVALAGALAGCGAGSPRQPPLPRPRNILVSPVSPAAPRQLAPAIPVLGATQQVDAAGAHLAVTATRLIDPLAGSGASLLPGTRAVGVEVRIASTGPAVYDSSATGDFSLRLSTGGASPVFAPTGRCRTPLRDFDNYITAGEVRTGCVVFQVPSGATVTIVRFAPQGQPAGRISWRTAAGAA